MPSNKNRSVVLPIDFCLRLRIDMMQLVLTAHERNVICKMFA